MLASDVSHALYRLPVWLIAIGIEHDDLTKTNRRVIALIHTKDSNFAIYIIVRRMA
jgi:hypothetical protein